MAGAAAFDRVGQRLSVENIDEHRVGARCLNTVRAFDARRRAWLAEALRDNFGERTEIDQTGAVCISSYAFARGWAIGS